MSLAAAVLGRLVEAGHHDHPGAVPLRQLVVLAPDGLDRSRRPDEAHANGKTAKKASTNSGAKVVRTTDSILNALTRNAGRNRRSRRNFESEPDGTSEKSGLIQWD